MATTDLVDRVLNRRRELGLSQAAVAAACGITQGHLSKIEKSKAPLVGKAKEALLAWLEGRRPVRANGRSLDLIQIADQLEAQAKVLRELAAVRVE